MQEHLGFEEGGGVRWGGRWGKPQLLNVSVSENIAHDKSIGVLFVFLSTNL